MEKAIDLQNAGLEFASGTTPEKRETLKLGYELVLCGLFSIFLGPHEARGETTS